MNIDELNTIGEIARQMCAKSGGSIAAMTRAKTRALVEALRDELRKDNGFSHPLFNEILGSDAGTHGSPELDEDARKLEAMGQDAGLTIEEIIGDEVNPLCTVPCGTQRRTGNEQ